jgi:hypothetical protein
MVKGWKYLSLAAGIIAVFSQFVACGSAMYQVSMREDTHSPTGGGANPDMDNPKSETYGIHALGGWGHEVPIYWKGSRDLSDEAEIQLRAAMKKWEWAVGRELFIYEGPTKIDPEKDFVDLMGSLGDGENGQYLLPKWDTTGKPATVLGTTIWDYQSGDGSAISNADIKFNSENYLICDSLVEENEKSLKDYQEIVDMQSLALHELGHLLGLGHVSEDIDSFSIMNPSIYVGPGLTSRRFSKGDIERIQKIYGCDGEACDLDTLMEKEDAGSGVDFTVEAENDYQAAAKLRIH